MLPEGVERKNRKRESRTFAKDAACALSNKCCLEEKRMLLQGKMFVN